MKTTTSNSSTLTGAGNGVKNTAFLTHEVKTSPQGTLSQAQSMLLITKQTDEGLIHNGVGIEHPIKFKIENEFLHLKAANGNVNANVLLARTTQDSEYSFRIQGRKEPLVLKGRPVSIKNDWYKIKIVTPNAN